MWEQVNKDKYDDGPELRPNLKSRVMCSQSSHQSMVGRVCSFPAISKAWSEAPGSQLGSPGNQSGRGRVDTALPPLSSRGCFMECSLGVRISPVLEKWHLLSWYPGICQDFPIGHSTETQENQLYRWWRAERCLSLHLSSNLCHYEEGLLRNVWFETCDGVQPSQRERMEGLAPCRGRKFRDRRASLLKSKPGFQELRSQKMWLLSCWHALSPSWVGTLMKQAPMMERPT